MDTTDQFLIDDQSSDEEQEQQHEGSETELETDASRLAQRQKQIDFGKNTQAYKNYIKAVPKHTRKLRGKDAHPSTPDITLRASKRCWAGIVRKWRRSLHQYDYIPDAPVEADEPSPQPSPLQQQRQRQQQQSAQPLRRLPYQQRQQQQQQQQHQKQTVHSPQTRRQRGQHHHQEQHQPLHPQQHSVEGRPLPMRRQQQQQHQGQRLFPQEFARTRSGQQHAAPQAVSWQRGRGARGPHSGGRRAPNAPVEEQQQQQQQQQPKGRTSSAKTTPSKRQRSRAAGDPMGEEAQGDGSTAWQRDTPSKRSRPSQQQPKQQSTPSKGSAVQGGRSMNVGHTDPRAATRIGAAVGGPPRKSWADQVDDAFGDWMD